ncbi:MAG: response regulator [Planctomycetes bacterium]|nr:response regulator [Planctomycetota bacterium]
MQAELVVIRGKRIGESFGLAHGARVVFGEDQGCECRIPDSRLAGRHFVIEERNESHFLSDLDSPSGTFVNGQRVLTTQLVHGDRVRVGDLELMFYCKRGAHVPSRQEFPQVQLLDAPEEKIKRRIDARSARLPQVGRKNDVIQYVKIIKSLSTIYKVGNAIFAERDPKRLFHLVMDAILKSVKAERGFLFLVGEDEALEPVVVRTPFREDEHDPPAVSRTVVNETIRNAAAILCYDATTDSRFKSGDSVISYGIKSVMCVPLVGQGRVLGAIYLDSISNIGVFTEHELELLTAIGRQTGIALERTRLEEGHARTVHHLESVVAGVPLGIMAFDLEGTFTHWSPYCTAAFGYSREDVVARLSVKDLVADPAVLTTALQTVMREGLFEGEVTARRRDGEEVPCLLSLARLSASDGGHAGFTGYLLDLSRRVEVQDRLIRQERLATLGFLAADLSRELDSIVGGLAGFAALAQRSLRYRDQLVEMVIEQTRRASELTANLVAFAGPRPDRMEGADLADVLDRALRLLGRDLERAGITVVRAIEPVPTTVVHVGQVEEAILGLLINARLAAGQGGRIEVGLRRDGEWVELRVSDSGPALERERLARVFDPFYTVKGEGETGGTGLGLNLVSRIVRRHGGTVRVESEASVGTTFRVRLPLRAERRSADQPVSVERRTSRPGPRRRILVVDDEPFMADLFVEVLAGHDVVAVDQGAQAVDLARGEAFDCVFLDLVLPGEMDGLATFEALKQVQGHPKVFLVTGRKVDERLREVIGRADGFLRKPFEIDEIHALMAEAFRSEDVRS